MTSGVSLSAALEAFILEHGYCGGSTAASRAIASG